MKKSTKIKHKSPVMVVLGIILALYVIAFAILIIWGFLTSVKAYQGTFNVFRHNEMKFPEGMPWEWEWKNYATVVNSLVATNYVWVDGVRQKVRADIVDMMVNTAFYTVGGASVMTFLPCVVAYATSKTQFKFSKIFDAVILIVMVIPIVGSYPSEIQLLNDLGIYDSWIGYYVTKAHCISAYYLIFTALFRSVSYTYSEAAYIEGAGEYTVMLRVIMPLARTVILTIFLIHFITIWNDYNTSLLYMPAHPSLAYGIFYLVFQGDAALAKVPVKMAGSFLLFTPILALFLCFRKALMQNLSMGGLKE